MDRYLPLSLVSGFSLSVESAPPFAAVFESSELRFLSRQRSITAFISECKCSRTCASRAFIDYNIAAFLNGVLPSDFFFFLKNRRKLQKKKQSWAVQVFLYLFNISVRLEHH